MGQPTLVWQLPRAPAGPACERDSYRAREMYAYRGLTALCGRRGAAYCLLIRRGEFATPADFLDGGADFIEDGLPNRGAALRRFKGFADRAIREA